MSHCICGVATAVRGSGDEIALMISGRDSPHARVTRVGVAPTRSNPRLFVRKAVFFQRNRAKLQDNPNVFNECLRENAD